MNLYVELRCRSYYSFLRGASSPGDLVKRALEIGLTGLALTDRDGVYGVPRAYLQSRDHPHFKLVVGAELSLKDKPRLSLLARNRVGYGLLCRLITASHADQPKGCANLDWNTFLRMVDRPEAKGLIALSEDGMYPEHANSLEYYQNLKDIFGDRFYLPLIRVLDGWDAERTRLTRKLSEFLRAEIVAVNDVQFHSRERKRVADVLTAIRENCPLDQVGFKIFSNAERHLKSPSEMYRLFQDLPSAVQRSVEIAERCDFSLKELRYRYPSEWIPANETAMSYLKKLVWKGAHWRYGDEVPREVDLQLNHELNLIGELEFADYFLTIWEIVEFARSRGILCQGRGSAANSVVCYCLGITAIDPVRMGLLFERFLSVERGEPPDIDVDFEHERREEVIQYIYSKYGRDRAGMVAAVITYRSRSSLRDLSKALTLPPEDDRIGPLAREFQGIPRHLSIHSGGFTLSSDPLIETVPIEPARMPGRTIVQWDKDDLAIVGLLKVDVLSLGMLTALRKTFDLIRPRVDLTLSSVPPEDAATYSMIQRADTIGLFQIESRAQMNMLGRLRPENFYDLVVQVAIVRPGPIQGQMVHPYLRRRRGLEPATSPHPKLEAILGKTLGVPLFQEQVMKMAIHLAGFTPGESDELRRAIGAWRSSGSIKKMGRRLAEGLFRSGLSQEFVLRILKQIEGFSEYGFPESHAASFALIAYASAYLKCHYPAEFTCAVINSQPMGFYASHTLIDDVKRHGVSVLPVDPQRSDWDCLMENGAIRLGLRLVRGLGQVTAARMMKIRAEKPFTSLADFIYRSSLGFTVLQNLCLGDAFACFGLNQRESLWEVLRYSLPYLIRPEAQGDLFRGHVWDDEASAACFARFSEYESVKKDYAVYGASVRGHPMEFIRRQMRQAIFQMDTAQIKFLPTEQKTSIAGVIIVRQRPQTAKGTVFATLEDEKGLLDLILHNQVLEKYKDVFLTESFVKVSGRLQKDGDSAHLLVHRIEPMFSTPSIGEVGISSRDFK